jgi:hypothetical protein
MVGDLCPRDRNFVPGFHNLLHSIHLTIRIYFEINEIFTKMAQRQGEYASYDNELISAIKEGKNKFNKYFDLMKANYTYYISSVSIHK